MASDPQAGSRAVPTPPKVIGLGAPISVWIYFEVSEIPAVLDAIRDQLAEYAERPAPNGTRPADDGDAPGAWSDHIGELEQMLAAVERAQATHAHGRFDVVWPTMLAHGVVHGAVGHARRRAAADALCTSAPSWRRSHAARMASRRAYMASGQSRSTLPPTRCASPAPRSSSAPRSSRCSPRSPPSRRASSPRRRGVTARASLERPRAVDL